MRSPPQRGSLMLYFLGTLLCVVSIDVRCRETFSIDNKKIQHETQIPDAPSGEKSEKLHSEPGPETTPQATSAQVASGSLPEHPGWPRRVVNIFRVDTHRDRGTRSIVRPLGRSGRWSPGEWFSGPATHPSNHYGTCTPWLVRFVWAA